MGYTNVWEYGEGKEAWIAAGRETELLEPDADDRSDELKRGS